MGAVATGPVRREQGRGRSQVDGLAAGNHDLRAAGNLAVQRHRRSGSAARAVDGRGLVEERAAADDRGRGALIGGIIGGIGGMLLGGPIGAIGGAAMGAAIGALVSGQCPVPIAVRNGPAHSPIDTADAAGMSIAITLTSSTGVDADMAGVQDSEQVSASLNHTGSYTAIPSARSSNSGYMAGFPIPNDQHSEPKARIIDLADNHGGNGTMDRQQLDTFTAPDCGITTPVAIPNSGYLIRRSIVVSGTEIRFRLEKSPQDVTVNGFTASAGPSPTQSEEVVVRT